MGLPSSSYLSTLFPGTSEKPCQMLPWIFQGRGGDERPEPLDARRGSWVCSDWCAEKGWGGEVGESRSRAAEPQETGSLHGASPEPQAGQPRMAPELSVMSLPPGWTETYDFWWLGGFLRLVLSAYLSHLSLWRGRAITYTVQNREHNKTSSTGGPEPVPFKESRGALQDEVGVGPGTRTNASLNLLPRRSPSPASWPGPQCGTSLPLPWLRWF